MSESMPPVEVSIGITVQHPPVESMTDEEKRHLGIIS